MEEKIEKIFSYFSSIKNEPFYTSCVSQLVQIYESTPQSLKFILFNLNQLVFSTCKEPKLRLKHRLICATLIQKLTRIYQMRLQNFVSGALPFELQSFQLENCAQKPIQGNVANTPHTTLPHSNASHWTNIDFLQLIETEPLLVATAKGKSETVDYSQEQKHVFDLFLDMNHATMLNIENVFKDVEIENEVTDEAILKGKNKYKSKIEKYSLENKLTEVQFTISNPFNLMYEICTEHLLHSEWELRHMSVLILKELLSHSTFLGFSHRLSMGTGVSERYAELSSAVKLALAQHKRIDYQDLISRVLMLLALDRFADYQSDESIIIIRMVAADILVHCFSTIKQEHQLKLIRMLKKIFEKEAILRLSTEQAEKFTWEVKHSFLYFLSRLLQKTQVCGKVICDYLEEPLIKMLSSDQFDEITLYVCKILEQFLSAGYLTNEKLQRVNRQVWAVLQNLDDISLSAKQTLSLLGKLFPFFKLNEGNCLQRLRKFFTSKIPQVRVEHYKLMTSLLERRKDIADPKIVERTLVQFMQAVIIEHDPLLFDCALQMATHVLYYTKKAHNLRKVVELINTCVTPHLFTEEIILSKFIVDPDNQPNDYLYINEHQNVHCSAAAYTDKRTWKVAQALFVAFENDQGLEQVTRAIEKNNQKNQRARLMLLYLMTKLRIKFKNKANNKKLYEEYRNIAKKTLEMEYYEISDNQIIKIYVPQFQKKLKQLQQKEGIEESIKNKLLQISEILVKNGLVSKAEVEIGLKLKQLYENKASVQSQTQYLLSIIDNIMQIQKQLQKQLKVVGAHYIIEYDAQVQSLNTIIKPIVECMREDSYSFISQATASAALSLSLALHHTKKVAYAKFNRNIYFKVSSNYIPNSKYIQQSTIKIKAGYMQAVSSYITQVGSAIPFYLDEFGDCFLEESKEGNAEEEAQRIIRLLAGTCVSVASADYSSQFTPKLTTKLSQLANKVKEKDTQNKIINIMYQLFVHYCSKYTANSNCYYEWFLKELEQGSKVHWNVLEKSSQYNLVTISPICSVFVLSAVRTLTNQNLHELAINCLSNLIVGVYTNIQEFDLSPYLKNYSNEGKQFVKNFKNAANFIYQINVPLHNSITLRHYQIEGICWLGFLTKYCLNGALCDDMGLGKTLQVLILIENQYHKTMQQRKHQSKICQELNSIIVAPATLLNHWAHEHEKYFVKPVCQTCILKSKKDIPKLLTKYSSPVIFFASYQLIEKCVSEKLCEFKFVILDEGHAIKNVRTNKFKAVKSICAIHRFILTGTPIQNRLIELWGLFDFLMPGYLYTEETFKKHYEKLFQVNLTTFKEDELLFSESQRNALEKLHLKVMPFIMRRMKCDVLKELPQKIINDYYCELTPVQHKHYDTFKADKLRGGKLGESSALVSLQTLIKIVNHPILFNKVRGDVVFEDSGKFIALQQLFEQFGFAQTDSLLQNKAIVFAKEKQTIDLIEQFLNEKYSNIKHCKLTGDTKTNDRFTVAQTFNGDLDIKVLLVTKAVGGEGLNLSSANMVVMFDSDYNPTVDMQAIDRAHRIGQRKVLNVYRLITKDTLEEKIMGIQKFKANLAYAIVNLDNASISNVQQSRLPDLLESVKDLPPAKTAAVHKSMIQSLIEEMEKNAVQPEQYNKLY